MAASQGAELERVGVAVRGLIRLWKSVEKSTHPRMIPLSGAPGSPEEQDIGG